MAVLVQKFKARAAALPTFDVPFLIILLALLSYGLIMLFSAGYAVALYRRGDAYTYIRPQLLFAALGVAAMYAASLVDYHIWHKLAWPMLGLSLVLLTVVLFMPEYNGCKRWIVLPGLGTLQPSEIAKFSVVLVFSHIISLNHDRMKTFSTGVLPFALILGTVTVLMLLEPHLSGTLLILSIGAVLMFVGGTGLQWFGLAGGLGVAAIAAAVAARHFDAAFVCTAPLTHAGIIGELLDAGLPVFTELNLVDDGYDALIANAAQKGLPLFLSSTMLYRAETQYIKRRVAAFAKPVNYIYHIGQYLPDWHPWENYKNFFVGDRRTGGVREIFGIDLPWLLDAFGPVKHVYAEKDKLSGLEIDYPDSYFVTLRHENGTKGLLAADVVSPKAVRNFEVFGEGLHLFWEGNPRALYSYNAETREKEFVDTYGSFEHDARYSDNIVENAYVDEITNFFGVLAGREQPRWSFEKDKEAIALIERIEGA